MSLATPPRFALTTHNSGHLALASDQGDTAHVFVLENDIIRILVLPDGRLDQHRTFAVAPGLVVPVRLAATNRYYGVLFSDLLNLTPDLILSLAGRFNVANFNLQLGWFSASRSAATRFRR